VPEALLGSINSMSQGDSAAITDQAMFPRIGESGGFAKVYDE